MQGSRWGLSQGVASVPGLLAGCSVKQVRKVPQLAAAVVAVTAALVAAPLVPCGIVLVKLGSGAADEDLPPQAKMQLEIMIPWWHLWTPMVDGSGCA